MDDPATRVPAQLLPHMHLISRCRYPSMQMLPSDTVLDYLLSASRIVRELHPMHWTFLDGPPDGSLILTWQPLNQLGTNFASDGYVWADVEQAFTFEVRGYTVEMWIHRSGYHPPNEQTAVHCRRRYRLLPNKAHNPNLLSPDPSLWIIHYSRAPPTDHIPAARIPILPQVQAMLSQRRFLQAQGQLARKDFMLHDRNNWPTISFPQQVAAQGMAQPQVAYPNSMAARSSFYAQPGQAAAGMPVASKAPRGHRAPSAAISAAVTDFALEDEDTAAGDLMDLLTPREVSKMRYQQHHEWMEEIFASPYAISQITPVALGLGRKGELESLTAGFFDAPVNSDPRADINSQNNKMKPVNAEEFADRVARKIADMTAEIEKLKKRHARRMENFNRTSVFKDSELYLRDAATNPTDIGPEVWRLEGRIETPEEEDGPRKSPSEVRARYKVCDVIQELEGKCGKQIVLEPAISCVQKGGLLEKVERGRREEASEGDVLMDTADTHFLDQFAAAPEQGTSAQQEPPTSQVTAGTPAASNPEISRPNRQAQDFDIDMGMGDGGQESTAAGETGDWVVIGDNDKDGTDATGGRPGGGLQELTPGNAGDTVLDGGGFDFSNMDTAGDALAAYSEQNDGLELPDLDNSAFGDAFHASDSEPVPGDGDEM